MRKHLRDHCSIRRCREAAKDLSWTRPRSGPDLRQLTSWIVTGAWERDSIPFDCDLPMPSMRMSRSEIKDSPRVHWAGRADISSPNVIVDAPLFCSVWNL